MKDTQVIQVQFFGSGSSVPVERHPEPMCARGSIPLPTTKSVFVSSVYKKWPIKVDRRSHKKFSKRFVCLSKLTYLCNETGQRNGSYLVVPHTHLTFILLRFIN